MASNKSFSGSSDATITFDRAVTHLNIGVETGVTFSFSVDGTNFVPVDAGFHSLKIGSTKTLYIQANGNWGLIGVQG